MKILCPNPKCFDHNEHRTVLCELIAGRYVVKVATAKHRVRQFIAPTMDVIECEHCHAIWDPSMLEEGREGIN